MSRTEDILNELSLFIIPHPELNYSNNYELLIATLLSSQTTDKHVNLITPSLFSKYPSTKELMKANILDVINIIKPLGLSNIKGKNIILLSKTIEEKYIGVIPNTLEDLESLPGVGRKTAQVVLALGFNIPSLPVDTHIFRVSKRLGIVGINDNILDVELKLKNDINKDRWIEAHHLLLLFGRYYCKAKMPLCEDCKMKKYCKSI
jgi:endonuclease III